VASKEGQIGAGVERSEKGVSVCCTEARRPSVQRLLRASGPCSADEGELAELETALTMAYGRSYAARTSRSARHTWLTFVPPRQALKELHEELLDGQRGAVKIARSDVLLEASSQPRRV
jgi:hypothetical protein